MSDENKTPFRKNLDKRYISGEDLLNGIELNKGLRPEMVVTLVNFNDAPAFDQRAQAEVNKTALHLREYPSGKLLYKPALLNVARAKFMSTELAGGSLFIDDCDTNKPFVIYAKPDKKHGHVVAFKKYIAPPTVTDVNALSLLSECSDLDALSVTWKSLSKEEKLLPTVLAKKEAMKEALTK